MKAVCLMGNPNCGKTTLFNTLTGTYQKVGNFAGVTTSAKEGVCKFDKELKIVDLPGMYSLSALTSDEKAVNDYIKVNKPSVIINVLDGTNLERNLYLTLELATLNIPMVLAVNFSDDLKKNGIKLSEEELSKTFGMPVVSVSALKKTNIDKLVSLAKNTSTLPKKLFEIDANPEILYEFLRKEVPKIINKTETKSEKITSNLDKILLNGKFGILLFAVIIFSVYFLSMKLGGLLGESIENFFDGFTLKTKKSLMKVNVASWIASLICDGIFRGFSSVIGFLPQLLILFALMTLLEESGYMSRVAFIFDGLLKRIGLGGKSVIPLIISCGCAVSGIMATRSIDDEREKTLTVFLSSFMPCGAKSAVFGYISHVFFNNSAIIATSMYLMGIFAVIIYGKILTRFKYFRNGQGNFVLEIPTLRFPSFKDVFMTIAEKTKDFCLKVGSVIFILSVFVWFLSNFNFGGYIGNNSESFLFYIGNAVKYLFYPLGFPKWETAVSLISGIFAKEGIVETLTLLGDDFYIYFDNPMSVYAFMAFILLSPPCIATLSVAKKELKNNKKFCFMLLFQFVSAYITSLLINMVGIIIFSKSGLILSVSLGIIVVVIMLLLIKRLLKKMCKNCKERCAKCRDYHNTTL